MGSVGKTIWHHTVSTGGKIIEGGLHGAHAAEKVAGTIGSGASGGGEEPEEFALPSNGLHRIYHTAHITLNGEKHTFTLITNADGQAMNDVVLAGKTVVAKGEQIF
ncbi:hypothetical protein [Ascidiaceihabitans sp.]|uniref:hypothetical protein n=1 Tax=Ascidiaceihabitans sp. TaxID=1872644 RepID=UPI0032979149